MSQGPGGFQGYATPRAIPAGLASVYWVFTATLVAPRMRPPVSEKRTNTRWSAGSYGTVAVPMTKTANAEVAPASITVVTLGTIGVTHHPVAGSV